MSILKPAVVVVDTYDTPFYPAAYYFSEFKVQDILNSCIVTFHGQVVE